MAAVVAVPWAMQGRTVTDTWQPWVREVVETTPSVTQERVVFPQQLDRMQRVNDTLVAVMYPAGCSSIDCATRDVGVLTPDSMKIVRSVPAGALDEERVLDNDGRVLWTEAQDNDARYTLFELDTETAEARELARDIFLGRTSSVGVAASGEYLYFEAASDREMENGVFAVSIHRSGVGQNPSQTIVMNDNWRKSGERIEDVSDNNRIVSLYTFPNGDQELWWHQRVVERGTVPRPVSQAIPGSYTIDGHLVGAHFVTEDVIEFFRFQSLMRYTISTDTLEEVGERLYWVADQSAQEQLVITDGPAMYYVAQADTGLEVRKRVHGVTTTLGAADPNDLWIDGQKVAARSVRTIEVPDVGTRTTYTIDEFIADTGEVYGTFDGAVDVDGSEAAAVWIDETGTVFWGQERENDTVNLAVIGQGTRVWLVDDLTPVWQGFDGRVYTAQIRTDVQVPTPTAERFVKVAGAPAVYLIENGQRYAMPDERTFFTWAQSFDQVETVSQTELNSYANGGFAQLKPGTMIKTATSKHVYVVQGDWYRQRLANEEVARQIYGAMWWQQIHTVDATVINAYQEINHPIDSVQEHYQNL